MTDRQVGTNANTHKLTIRNLSYTELANFTCKAENEVGFSKGHIEVTCEGEVSEEEYHILFSSKAFPSLLS